MHTRKPSVLTAAFVATVLGLFVTPTPASANLLTNGSFEAVDASAPPFFIRSFASTPGWTQILDGVDLIHNSYGQANAPFILVNASDGVQYLDMNQQNLIGGLEQVVPATAGVSYALQLDTCAWATNARGGTIGYELYNPANNQILASGTLTDAIGGTWITRSLQADAISTEIGVRIVGIVATQAGMGLDNVSLSAVPEPTSLAVISLAGLGLIRRKR